MKVRCNKVGKVCSCKHKRPHEQIDKCNNLKCGRSPDARCVPVEAQK